MDRWPRFSPDTPSHRDRDKEDTATIARRKVAEIRTQKKEMEMIKKITLRAPRGTRRRLSSATKSKQRDARIEATREYQNTVQEDSENQAVTPESLVK
jgi:hypothetical protein